MLTPSPWLMSDETGEPFRHCVYCRLPLLEIDAPWLVTKEYRMGECILEYAVCKPCRAAVSDGFSEESKAAVRSFLETRIDSAARTAEFMMDPTLETRMGSCIACRTPRSQMHGFGISALFDSGGYLVEGLLPLLLCENCTRELSTRLSPDSVVKWRTALMQHLDGPPNNIEDLPGPGYL